MAKSSEVSDLVGVLKIHFDEDINAGRLVVSAPSSSSTGKDGGLSNIFAVAAESVENIMLEITRHALSLPAVKLLKGRPLEFSCFISDVDHGSLGGGQKFHAEVRIPVAGAGALIKEKLRGNFLIWQEHLQHIGGVLCVDVDSNPGNGILLLHSVISVTISKQEDYDDSIWSTASRGRMTVSVSDDYFSASSPRSPPSKKMSSMGSPPLSQGGLTMQRPQRSERAIEPINRSSTQQPPQQHQPQQQQQDNSHRKGGLMIGDIFNVLSPRSMLAKRASTFFGSLNTNANNNGTNNTGNGNGDGNGNGYGNGNGNGNSPPRSDGNGYGNGYGNGNGNGNTPRSDGNRTGAQRTRTHAPFSPGFSFRTPSPSPKPAVNMGEPRSLTGRAMSSLFTSLQVILNAGATANSIRVTPILPGQGCGVSPITTPVAGVQKLANNSTAASLPRSATAITLGSNKRAPTASNMGVASPPTASTGNKIWPNLRRNNNEEDDNKQQQQQVANNMGGVTAAGGGRTQKDLPRRGSASSVGGRKVVVFAANGGPRGVSSIQQDSLSSSRQQRSFTNGGQSVRGSSSRSLSRRSGNSLRRGTSDSDDDNSYHRLGLHNFKKSASRIFGGLFSPITSNTGSPLNSDLEGPTFLEELMTRQTFLAQQSGLTGPGGKGKNFLVVDDSSDARKIIRRMLVEQGQCVREAVDGFDCVRCVEDAGKRGETFDVILLDENINLMSGKEVAKQLRDRGFERTIIGLTSSFNTYSVKTFLDSGANAVLTKPVDITKLESELKAIEVRRMLNSQESAFPLLVQPGGRSGRSSIDRTPIPVDLDTLSSGHGSPLPIMSAVTALGVLNGDDDCWKNHSFSSTESYHRKRRYSNDSAMPSPGSGLFLDKMVVPSSPRGAGTHISFAGVGSGSRSRDVRSSKADSSVVRIDSSVPSAIGDDYSSENSSQSTTPRKLTMALGAGIDGGGMQGNNFNNASSSAADAAAVGSYQWGQDVKRMLSAIAEASTIRASLDIPLEDNRGGVSSPSQEGKEGDASTSPQQGGGGNQHNKGGGGGVCSPLQGVNQHSISKGDEDVHDRRGLLQLSAGKVGSDITAAVVAANSSGGGAQHKEEQEQHKEEEEEGCSREAEGGGRYGRDPVSENKYDEEAGGTAGEYDEMILQQQQQEGQNRRFHEDDDAKLSAADSTPPVVPPVADSKEVYYNSDLSISIAAATSTSVEEEEEESVEDAMKCSQSKTVADVDDDDDGRSSSKDYSYKLLGDDAKEQNNNDNNKKRSSSSSSSSSSNAMVEDANEDGEDSIVTVFEFLSTAATATADPKDVLATAAATTAIHSSSSASSAHSDGSDKTPSSLVIPREQDDSEDHNRLLERKYREAKESGEDFDYDYTLFRLG